MAVLRPRLQLSRHGSKVSAVGRARWAFAVEQQALEVEGVALFVRPVVGGVHSKGGFSIPPRPGPSEPAAVSKPCTLVS